MTLNADSFNMFVIATTQRVNHIHISFLAVFFCYAALHFALSGFTFAKHYIRQCSKFGTLLEFTTLPLSFSAEVKCNNIMKVDVRLIS